MTEQNYWKRVALSRRRLIGAAAVTASGTAMLAMFGCSSNNNKKVATAQVGSKATVAGKTATPAAQEPKRGGTLQMRQLKDFNFDALTNATPCLLYTSDAADE